VLDDPHAVFQAPARGMSLRRLAEARGRRRFSLRAALDALEPARMVDIAIAELLLSNGDRHTENVYVEIDDADGK